MVFTMIPETQKGPDRLDCTELDVLVEPADVVNLIKLNHSLPHPLCSYICWGSEE